MELSQTSGTDQWVFPTYWVQTNQVQWLFSMSASFCTDVESFYIDTWIFDD